MNGGLRKIPTHEVTYGRLRDMVLFGQLEPGQPVTIQGLIRDLEVGMTPVREAIRRLTAEGALTLQGNRRVCVPRLTPALLDQVAFVRLAVEPRLARLAAAALTPDLIARLAALDAGVDRAMAAGDVHGYLAQNHQFHFLLYDLSGPVCWSISRNRCGCASAPACGWSAPITAPAACPTATARRWPRCGRAMVPRWRRR